jgi:ectoine hydroxylase-related dioxygenase (phytanoyl-CoA dioxygenase family)
MRLTEDQVKTFREEGVLVVENVVTEGDLAPVIEEYEGWIDRRARELQAEGKIAALHEGEPFTRRFGLLYAQSREIERGLDIMQARGPATFAFLGNANLLDAVECLVGPEITCSPIQHIRAKPPASMSGEGAGFYNVPWHQDAGVTWEEADDSDIVTCWVAMVDATPENGCMEVMPGVFRHGYREHQAEGGTTIRPDLLPDVSPRPVPVRKGGAVFMHRYTPHRSTPNRTEEVRWSIDLRYQKTGTPTGRPFHPDFVVRSRAHPETVLTDPTTWARLWEEALAQPPPRHAHRVK